MQWEAIGADRNTGREFTLTVEADDADQATRRAGRRGMMVESVRPLNPEDSVADVPALVELASAVEPASPRQVGQPRIAGGVGSAPPVYVQVNNQTSNRGISGFGVASLVCGIIACLGAWLPIIGLFTMPIAGIGALIGCVGMLVSIIGRRSGVGMPVAGLFVSILAIVIAGASAGLTAASISRAAANANRTFQSTAGLNSAALPTTSGSDEAVTWAPMNAPVLQGDALVHVTAVRIGKVPLTSVGRESSQSADELLMIDLDVANVSETRKLDYRSWAGADFATTRDYATLTDNFGNVYKRTSFGLMNKPSSAVESGAIYPNKPLTDQLVFEVPLSNIAFLHLELPAKNVGGEGMFRIELPSSMIQHGPPAP